MGKIVTVEVDETHARVAQANFKKAGVAGKVDLRLGKALELLPKMISENEGPFDMIFIDADKPPYAEYFEYALQLSRPGTLIICDNVIREGKVLDQNPDDASAQGAKRFNEVLARHNDVVATILQTVGVKDHDGIGHSGGDMIT